jgi:ABC-transporter N-terminal/ABC transporter
VDINKKAPIFPAEDLQTNRIFSVNTSSTYQNKSPSRSLTHKDCLKMADSLEANEKGDQAHTDNDGEILEKTKSLQHNVLSTQAPSSEADSSSLKTPSEHALEELIPQLTRRGTINPDSPYFSTEKFLRDLMARAKEQGLKRRSAGVCFRGLVVLGYGSDFTHQNTVGTVATGVLRIGDSIRAKRHPPMKTILYTMDGVVREGEMLLVLGKPGSGATTLLKTIAGQTRGYASVSGGFSSKISPLTEIDIHYNGIPAKIMHQRFRGEVAYNGEVDIHFPHLTVEQTLRFAAKLRIPHTRVDNSPRKSVVTTMVNILGTVFGLRHTFNTKVGV